MKHGPDVGDNRCPLRNVVTFVYVILSEAVGDTERRCGIPPVDFVKDRIEIWEISTVVVCWEALGGRGRIGEHLVEFGLCLLLHLGEENHGDEERLQR